MKWPLELRSRPRDEVLSYTLLLVIWAVLIMELVVENS
jgi:hypothetical protein